MNDDESTYIKRKFSLEVSLPPEISPFSEDILHLLSDVASFFYHLPGGSRFATRVQLHHPREIATISILCEEANTHRSMRKTLIKEMTCTQGDKKEEELE